MTRYDREDFACHLCFQDKVLREWITGEGRKGSRCPWCGRGGYLIRLAKLGDVFREVANLYVQAPDEHGDLISFLLDDDWGIFSEKLQSNGLAQQLAVSILYAGLSDKECFECPDYEGLFRRSEGPSLEEGWDEKACAALGGEISRPDKLSAIKLEGEIVDELPDVISLAFEDLALSLNEGTTLYRCRVHDSRARTERFRSDEVGAPPPGCAKAARANVHGEPVLYLASNKSTALAEVRAWKGAAVALAEMKLRRPLLLVDLSRRMPLGSPFFVEALPWKLALRALLRRLAEDMSRPVVKSEDEVLYKPTQLLSWLIRLHGYDGCKYPSAMGSGFNVLLFNPDDAHTNDSDITYLRVRRVAYFSEPLAFYEAPYEEGPYDHLVLTA